jgi:hypothetical protein
MHPMYGGTTEASQGQLNFPPYYSCSRLDVATFQIIINGEMQQTIRTGGAMPAASSIATASAPGPIIFPSINVSTTGGVTKTLTAGQPFRQYAFVFMGNRSIDQSILYNNVNNYLHSIGAAVVNS